MSGNLGLILQLVVVLGCLFYGAKKGGIALGLLGGIGLVILVFGFHLPPGKVPIAVMLTIIAVVAASATLQASGGLDVMLQIAEKILRRNPKYVTILAPFVTMVLTMLCGTGHIVYSIMPIIYDISIKNGIRPERPMAAASVSSQMGICASPVSVAIATFVASLATYKLANGSEIGLVTILAVTIPSTVFGVFVIGMFSMFRGKPLDDDEVFQKYIANSENKEYVYGSTATLLGRKLPAEQWVAMWIFLGSIVVVAFLGAFEAFRPVWCDVTGLVTANVVQDGVLTVGTKSIKVAHYIPIATTEIKNIVPFLTEDPFFIRPDVKQCIADGTIAQELISKGEFLSVSATNISKFTMVYAIQIFMFLAGALIVIFTKMDASKISKNEIFRSGMIAIVAVFGIAWMASTVFGAHVEGMKIALGDVVKDYPWTYAVMLLLVSKFLNSQAASVTVMVPIGLAVGVEPGYIIAFAAACYGYYILPTYPSDLATIQFDRSGTTRIGKYVINHSFIIPGLLGVISSCLLGFILCKILGYI